MQDKITLGKFIQSKRKAAGLSQKKLAERLYVTESAVSKWERGISYPDITMISELCRALDITEHELCTASDDENQRKIEMMAKRYKKFTAVYNIILALGYLSAIIPCFIIFVIIEHDLPKFCILLTSLMLSASLLNIPTLVEKNKRLVTLGSSYVSLNLLLLSGNIYSGGDWFVMAFLSVTLGFCIVLLPFVIRSECISKYIRKNKALICMAANTVTIIGTVTYGTLKYSTWESFVEAFVATVICLIPIWAIFGVIRYIGINMLYKISISLAIFSVWLMTAEKIAFLILSSDADFSITIYNAATTFSISVIILVLAGIFAVFGCIYQFCRKCR